jgi:hypothetical protein
MGKQDRSESVQMAGGESPGDPRPAPGEWANMGHGQHAMYPGQGENGMGGNGGHHFQHVPNLAVPGWPGYGYAASSAPGYAPGLDVMGQRRAGGDNGLSGLAKLLVFDDKDFWKGPLVGAAAALLLTNGSVQRALFRGAVKGRDSVQEGVDKVKASINEVGRKASHGAETGNE